MCASWYDCHVAVVDIPHSGFGAVGRSCVPPGMTAMSLL